MARRFVFYASVLSLFVVLAWIPHVFAIDEDNIKASEQIKKNPAMMEMLKRIELSKKILAEMQEQKKHQDQKTQQIQELRKNVHVRLDEDLKRMNNDYDQYSSQNAFSRFVEKKPPQVQNIYWSMFKYQFEKVKTAKEVRDKILSDGGTKKIAWDAYYKAAATNKSKLIELNKNLNIQHANADVNVQNTFDSKGKLPRTD